MLNIEKTVLPSPYQWEIIIEGMRNPMNSWDKSDSCIGCERNACQECEWICDRSKEHFMGENDLNLMKKLAKGGAVHAKYRRMIPVFVTVTAPLYWWKEFDTYKVGTVANSCSTMHKIHAKEFTLDDFSHEHLLFEGEGFETYPYRAESRYGGWESVYILEVVVEALNKAKDLYLETKDKKYWWQMIQLLPSSYNQKRTLMLNYEVLVGIYRDRRNHKLDEWHTFCDWIESLPYSELITGAE